MVTWLDYFSENLNHIVMLTFLHDKDRRGSILHDNSFIIDTHLDQVLSFLDKQTSLFSLQSLDRIKCRLLEGTNAQEVRAMVLDMQARLLLDMLGKGIESALINPSALVPDPWQASSDTLAGIDLEAMAVEPALVASIQVYI